MKQLFKITIMIIYPQDYIHQHLEVDKPNK